MRPLDLVLALATVVTWGLNFVVVKVGLSSLPPLLFTTLRFFFTALPLVFLVPRPRIATALWIRWGLLQFGLQFALLYGGMAMGMAAGLTSLVAQAQVFFFIALSMWRFKERPSRDQLLGAAIAAAGIVLVAVKVEAGATLIGLMLVLGAALTWGFANLLTKEIGEVKPLSLVAWGALVAFPALALSSFLLEGFAAWQHAFEAMTAGQVASVLYQAYPNTLFGFTVWSMLVRRYPSAVIGPVALLIPICGMAGGAVLLGEPMPWWKWCAALLVLSGLALNQMHRRPSRLNSGAHSVS